MAQVPDTNTFELQDVVDVVNPTTDDLVDCFADADDELFDPIYANRLSTEMTLLEFRNYNGNIQGLLYIIHPEDVDNGSTNAWSEDDNTFIGTTRYSIGSGNQNSIDIVADSPLYSAAEDCLDLNDNGYSDWFLPSRNTLANLLHPVKGLVNVGILGESGDTLSATEFYWRSSEVDNFRAYAVQAGGSGYQIVSAKDNSALAYYKSRAIRIQQNVDTTRYDIGDYAFGGIVFKKYRYGGTQGWILVMHKYELSTSVWSNVDVDLYPLSDNSFGDIETAAIIAQSGHTTSAAKLCNDLIAQGYTDWFLPTSMGKWQQRLDEINDGIESIGGDTISTSDQIWTSQQNQLDSTKARLLYVGTSTPDEDKQNVNKVRAVRKVFVDDLNSVQYGDVRDGGVVVYKSFNDPSQEDSRRLRNVYTTNSAVTTNYYFSEYEAYRSIYLMAGMTLYTDVDRTTKLSAGTYKQDGNANWEHINYYETDTATIVVGSNGVISSISGREVRATAGFDFYDSTGSSVIYRDTFYYDASIGDASNLSVGDYIYRHPSLQSQYYVYPSTHSTGKWEQNGVSYNDINEICTSSSTVGRILVGSGGGRITSISCV